MHKSERKLSQDPDASGTATWHFCAIASDTKALTSEMEGCSNLAARRRNQIVELGIKIVRQQLSEEDPQPKSIQQMLFPFCSALYLVFLPPSDSLIIFFRYRPMALRLSLAMASHLIATASNLIAMASNLVAISNLVGMASNLIAMAST